MICPKCNRKYEDDMPRCLWCDALKPNYGMDGPLPDISIETPEIKLPTIFQPTIPTVTIPNF